jgi:alpha-1,3/alpha-1,6-mannosyltransferase
MKKRVAILHPDLGIGGAEALIINVALALESKGYEVTVYTPFFDPNRCLKEAHLLNISVKGNWFPRTIFGRFIALCAYIRMILCALYVLFCVRQQDWYLID